MRDALMAYELQLVLFACALTNSLTEINASLMRSSTMCLYCPFLASLISSILITRIVNRRLRPKVLAQTRLEGTTNCGRTTRLVASPGGSITTCEGESPR